MERRHERKMAGMELEKTWWRTQDLGWHGAREAGVAGFARFGREPRCDVRWAHNHSRSCEFIMSMMQRWYNMHSHCFLLYSFSCILFATGASSLVWGLLLSMRIVYNKEAIRDSMLQVGRRIMQLGWNGTSCSLGFCVSDNCAYTNKLTYQHAEKDGHFSRPPITSISRCIFFVLVGSPSCPRQARTYY